MNRDGKYFDGKVPVSIPVSCIVLADGLHILNANTEEKIAVWGREDIFHDEVHNTTIVLGNRQSKERIELFNFEVAKNLGITQEKIIKTGHKYIYMWLGILVSLSLIFWFSLPFFTKVIAKRIPYDTEKSLGAKIPIDSITLSNDQKKALTTYASFLYPLTPEEKKRTIDFYVSDTFMINAFAYPGGRVVLTCGIINQTKTPEELLGIMSHEIGHVVARDSVNFLVRGAFLASFFGFLTGDFNSSFAVSPQVFLSTAALTFDRDMEKTADQFAAKRLGQLNVSTSGLRSFFSRREYEDSIDAPELLMTHPNYKNRVALIVETYPKENLPVEVLEQWAVIKGICK